VPLVPKGTCGGKIWEEDQLIYDHVEKLTEMMAQPDVGALKA